MARRSIYLGLYDSNARKSLRNVLTVTSKDFKWFINIAFRYFWTVHSIMCENYLAVVTVLAVVMLSYIIPDISERIHATGDLGDMKKVLDLMSKEVRLAEVACLTDVDEICQLQSSMQDDATETSKIVQDLSLCNKVRSTKSEPVQVENKFGFIRRILFPIRNTSRKEIAIMSYVYTDSFDDNTTTIEK